MPVAEVLSTRYTLRPAARTDVELLRRWLTTPQVRLWWGDPDAQIALLESDLDEPRMAMRIVSCDGVPFAYVQDYDVHDWPQVQFAHLPRGTRAVDAFIGEADMIGAGHGAAFLRLVAERLRAEGAPLVAIDTAVDNMRARRAYANAGFSGDVACEGEDGPVVLMTFRG